MKRILLVEDEPDVAEVFEIMLTDAGYDTTVVGSADQALELLASGPMPDVIVSDFLMPGTNGGEFGHAVRAMPGGQAVPFIFLTATSRELASSVFQDFDYIVIKPTKFVSFLALLRRCVEEGRPRRGESMGGGNA